MDNNEDRFFRDVTSAICSSLRMSESLHRALLLLKQHIPVDLMLVWVYDDEHGALRKFAMATEAGGHDIDELIPLHPATRKKLLGMDIPHTVIERNGLSPAVMRLVNQPDQDPVARSTRKYFEPQDYSSMVMYLESEGSRIGTLFVRTQGTNRYDATHVRLLSMFLEPMTLAAANAIHRDEAARKKRELVGERQKLIAERSGALNDRIIGEDYGLRNVIELAHQVAELGSPVLLRGETGTGKDVIANRIHQRSTQRDGPFIKVNCGAIPESLIDDELFGHEKGAFTGAIFQKRGYFEQADNGTIFLDEVGELPLSVQVRLLRVVQFKEIQRLGGSEPIRVNIRIIAATHRNLEEMVNAKLFREDLWFRLNVFPIAIPPLRQRKGDIPDLASHLIRKKCRELNVATTPTVPPATMKRLARYDWPGNVRELENIIERALILRRNGAIDIDALFDGSESRSPPEHPVTESVEPQSLDEAITAHIQTTLRRCGGKVQGAGGAAEMLRTNPSTLRNQMKRLGIAYGRRTARHAPTDDV